MTEFDVVVVGGGAAGLSGALTLGRSRRSVLVVDEGAPRNAPAAGVHNLLGRDGIAPADLLAAGRADAACYGVQVVDGVVTAAARDGSGFVLTLADASTVRARRLLVTTGLVDDLPEIDGLRTRWGRDVLHCPYCHGWEVRDEPIGVLGTSPFAVHQALLFRQWSEDVTLFLHTAVTPSDEEWEQLAARGIAVVDGEVVGVEVEDDTLVGVRLRSGRVVARRALTVPPRLQARSAVLESLGVQPVAHPMGVGTFVESDPTGLTAAAGVWVAGNVTDLMTQVVGAMAAGVNAGAAINADLIAEETRAAVAHRAAPFRPDAEATNCERLLGDRRHGLSPAG